MSSRTLCREEVEKSLKGTNIKLESECKGVNKKAKFRCFCGKIFETTLNKIIYKHTKSCGCFASTFGTQRKNLVGKKFGKLSVIRLKEVRDKKNTIWECLCDCGNTTYVFGGALTYGHTKSCGCLMYQYNKGKNNYMWKGVGDISSRFFHGIKGNARHRNIPFELTIDFIWKLFLKQDKKCRLTGEKLSFGECSKKQNTSTASLDRIDSKKGYIKGNVRWVHKIVNEMKFDLPMNKFLRYCYFVVNPIIDKEPCGIEDENCQNNGRWKGYKNLSFTYWNSVLTHAKNKNRPITLSIKEAWDIFEKQGGRCAITGLPLRWGYKGKQTASLDRIDSNNGYAVDNVQWIHKDINRGLKKDLNETDLRKWCKKIVDFKCNKSIIDRARECPVYEV